MKWFKNLVGYLLYIVSMPPQKGRRLNGGIIRSFIIIGILGLMLAIAAVRGDLF